MRRVDGHRALLLELHDHAAAPASIATIVPAEEGWVRVSLEASRLGWVAGVLAQLDAPFRIEQPEALRREVAALAGRLAARAAADAT